MKKQEYIVKNTTGRDANIGDLRIKIPAGKSRDLLSKTSRLSIEEILESEENGSLGRYLDKKILMKVIKVQKIEPPPIEISDPNAIVFPQRRKSSIIIDVGEIDDEVKDLVMNEDEEFLRQLDIENNSGSEYGSDIPVIAKDKS